MNEFLVLSDGTIITLSQVIYVAVLTIVFLFCFVIFSLKKSKARGWGDSICWQEGLFLFMMSIFSAMTVVFAFRFLIAIFLIAGTIGGLIYGVIKLSKVLIFYIDRKED